ncbi:uncharacterized protein LOC134224327 [Armigeres subalbatus]|uniref:uncharacterized protein LOC134224327 n=1 Tax=Armigeres subalbatus TaxID=124917 RepID=UPI002ED0BD16
MAQSADKTPRTRDQKKKKVKDLARELAEEKAKNATLREALDRSLQENPELDFNAENRMSSTRHMGPQSFEESKFFSSMNQLSVASINVPECKAPDGEEIHRQTYEMWKDLLVDSLKLAGVDDESTKFTVFKVKAGTRLLEIYRNTKSRDDAPDQVTAPFSNALHRLRTYFGSGSDVMLMRRKLSLMMQKPEETDLSFITRVGSTARLCEFDTEKEFEEIVSTVAEHARSREVRTTALKMLSRKCTFIDLVDKVREIETIRLNEEYVMRRHHNTEPASVAPVQSLAMWDNLREQRYPGNFIPRGSRGGSFQRGSTSRRGTWQANRGRQRGGFQTHQLKNGSLRSERCWRCGGVYHSASECTARVKSCNRCGRLGHIQRVCSYSEANKRPATEVLDTVPNKIAAIEVPDEELKDEPETKIASSPHACTALVSSNRTEQDSKPAKMISESLRCPTEAIALSAPSTITNVCVLVGAKKNDNSVHPRVSIVSAISPESTTLMTEGTILATVAGLRCSFLIDSGAEVNTFMLKLFNQMVSDPKYNNELFDVSYTSDRSLKAYATSGRIDVLATFHAYLHISEDRPTLLEKFYVVKENRALLSRQTACRYSVLMLGLNVPIRPHTTGTRDELFAGEIAAISSNGIFPKFNVPPVKIYYDTTKAPCRNVFVNVPLAVKPLVEKRLRELVSADIIERVIDGMDTSFCSSMLVVPKGKDDIRLVIDLRGPNRYIQRNPFAMPTLEKILAELDGAAWFSDLSLKRFLPY